MKLDFLKTAVSLLLILHVKDFDKLECYHSTIRYSLGFEYIREFPLSDQLLNLKSIDDHAHMEHHIIACIWHVRIIFLRCHLGLNC